MSDPAPPRPDRRGAVPRGASRVAGVVLAAGLATRMAGSKVTRPVDGAPMVARVVDAALGSGLDEVVVVVGHEAEQVSAVLRDRPVRLVDNPHYAAGMSTSLRAGLHAVAPGSDAVLFLLADQPFVSSALIDRLLAAFAAGGKPIVRPWACGRPANPVLFAARLFPELLREEGDHGGRHVVERHPDDVHLVEVDDPRLCLDVDSLDDYESLTRGQAGPVARSDRPRVVIKGAGDLATGVAVRLHRAGFAVVMTETAMPTVVRRAVAFAEAVYAGVALVEGIEAARATLAGVEALLARRQVPVVVTPDAGELLASIAPDLLIDAIVAKRNTGTRLDDAPAVVALGPGFVAGRDAHAVVETNRGHDLGRVLLEGCAQPDTGVPGEIGGYAEQRVVRSATAGVFTGVARIGDLVVAGDVVGRVGAEPVRAPLHGVLRGLLHDGVTVTPGFKVGDVDPRGERARCFTVSDKARAVAGGVLEAACLLLGGVAFGRSGERADP